MPATYAHWRFGDQCIKTLPNDLQVIINKHRKIFDYGVHGPDFLFYHKCLSKNDVCDYGYELHGIPFKDTLAMFKKNFKKADDSEATLAYLAGFVSHFTLDSYTHSYIEKVVSETDLRHGKIESQFERYLLIKDGHNPIKKSTTFSLKPNKKMAHDIAVLFDKLSDKEVYDSLKDMLFYLRLLKDNTDSKRWFLNKIMDKYKLSNYKDLLITKENDPHCKKTNNRIEKYWDAALKHYPLLMNEVIDYFTKDTKLGPYFDNTLSYKEDYKDIPLLEYEEELEYKI